VCVCVTGAIAYAARRGDKEEEAGGRATHVLIAFMGLPRRRPFVMTSASVIVGSICTATMGAGAAAAAPPPFLQRRHTAEGQRRVPNEQHGRWARGGCCGRGG
jgi:hypothetical protein